MLVKARLCVVEENATPAENAGRLKAEEIAEVMTRIDAGKGRKEGTRNDLKDRKGGVQDSADICIDTAGAGGDAPQMT
jgi:hypothetical protein